jgi:ATP-dependent protease ClpP protease subunit
MKKFWVWTRNEDTGQRELWLEGVIAEETWFGDEISPAIFKEELHAGSGPILLHISSPGGDCIAASQIYTMLMDYPADVIVQIDGVAASAASVIAMAGTTVRMSPTALMMVHNPWTTAMGDAEEMQKAIDLLSEVKESIINAYAVKSGLRRGKIAELMSIRPRQILGLPTAKIAVGERADLAIIDPDCQWEVIPEQLHSKSKNSVFKGERLKGKNLYTICKGKVVFEYQSNAKGE